MNRWTSIEAYHKVKDKLPRSRAEVFETLDLMSGPATSAEVFDLMQRRFGPRMNNLNKIRSRFTELRDQGVIREAGVRECKINGQVVIEWEITGNEPTKLPIKKPRKQTLLTQLELIRQYNRDPFVGECVKEAVKYLKENF